MHGTDPHLAAGVCEGESLAGKYRIERVLGVGGMGAVVAARHLQLDTKVAIKFLLPAMLDDAAAVSRFAREARAAVKITSEHVARVFDVGTLPNGAPYMVMEFLEGEDLAAWLQQRGPLPVEQAVEFVLQACVAVADAHGLGIVHRDLKPANLFCVLRSDGQFLIKVLDFGISKLTDLGTSAVRMSMTSTSAIMGSPLYMSPEQMQSPKGVDASTDIWALGVVLFELLAGRVPFTGDTFGEIAVKVATLPPPPLRSFRPDVPPGLEAAIRKCLLPNRHDRHRNVAEFAVAILPFAPKRARVSVERVSGIIQSSGLSASALGRPQSPAARGTALAPGTISPLGGTAPGIAPRRRAATAGVVGTVALVGAAIALVVMRPKGEAGDAPGSHSPASAPSGPAIPVIDAPTKPKKPETQASAAEGAPVLPPAQRETDTIVPSASSAVVVPSTSSAVVGPRASSAVSEVTTRSSPAKPRSVATASASGHPTPSTLVPAPVVAAPGPADVDPLSRLKLKP